MGVAIRSPQRASKSATPSADHLASDLVVPLERAAGAGVAVVGAKAANLGRAMAAGMPVLPGFVLSVAAVELLASAGYDAARRAHEELAVAWAVLSDNG